MRKFGRRIVELVLFILLLSLISFMIMKLAPGDSVREVLRADDVALSQEAIQEQRKEMGLDRPIWIQYTEWLHHLVQLDLGKSYMTQQPVAEELLSRLPATLLLTASSLFIMIFIAMPLGVLASLKNNGVIDQFSRGFAILGTSIPSFWLGILLIDLFSIRMGWVPSMGIGTVKHLILPSLTLGMTMAAVYVRVIRSNMLKSLDEKFIQGAMSRGVTKWRIIIKYALRDAMSPVIGMLGVSMGSLLGGTVVIEVLFAYPGMGKLAIDAIQNRDYPVLQGYVVILAVCITICHVLMDVIQLWLHPEIRLKGGKR
ncbi:ABC transporter permease [Bacillus altitudinis]|nr:ABC transporter permease [Bacillus altitudinis]